MILFVFSSKPSVSISRITNEMFFSFVFGFENFFALWYFDALLNPYCDLEGSFFSLLINTSGIPSKSITSLAVL